jgi:hypothetical protein
MSCSLPRVNQGTQTLPDGRVHPFQAPKHLPGVRASAKAVKRLRGT